MVRKIRISGVTKHFNNELKVLDDISFDVIEGEILAIVGPSGCGKTTLLQIMGGLQKPTNGNVFFNGLKLEKPNTNISYVFQEDSLLPWKTVRMNILFALEAIGIQKHEAINRVQKYVKMVDLEGFEDYYPHQLSGGMKQRAALARALSTEPQLMLMDEPLSSLDSGLKEKLQEKIRTITKKLSHTTVLISHDLEEVVFLADRLIILSERPSKLIKVIDINLPLNRIANVRTSEEFFQIKTRIWKLIRE